MTSKTPSERFWPVGNISKKVSKIRKSCISVSGDFCEGVAFKGGPHLVLKHSWSKITVGPFSGRTVQWTKCVFGPSVLRPNCDLGPTVIVAQLWFWTNCDSGPTVIVAQVCGPTVRTNCDSGPSVRDNRQSDLTHYDYGPTVRPNCDNGPSVRTNCYWGPTVWPNCVAQLCDPTVIMHQVCGPTVRPNCAAQLWLRTNCEAQLCGLTVIMNQVCGPTVIQDQVCVTTDTLMTNYNCGPTVRPNCDNGPYVWSESGKFNPSPIRKVILTQISLEKSSLTQKLFGLNLPWFKV